MKSYRLIQRFRSQTNGKVYEVKADEQRNLSCDCPAWIFKRGDKRTCKHVRYVEENLAHKNEEGNITYFSELTDIPTFEEAKRMKFVDDIEETRRWTEERTKVIERQGR